MSCSGHQTKLGSPPGKGNRNSTSETIMAKSPSAETDNNTILFWKLFFVARIIHWVRWFFFGIHMCQYPFVLLYPRYSMYCIYLPMLWLIWNISMASVGKCMPYIQSLDQWCDDYFCFSFGLIFISCFFTFPETNSKSPWKWRVGRIDFLFVRSKGLLSESNYEFWRKCNFWCLPVTLRSKIDGLPIPKGRFGFRVLKNQYVMTEIAIYFFQFGREIPNNPLHEMYKTPVNNGDFNYPTSTGVFTPDFYFFHLTVEVTHCHPSLTKTEVAIMPPWKTTLEVVIFTPATWK